MKQSSYPQVILNSSLSLQMMSIRRWQNGCANQDNKTCKRVLDMNGQEEKKESFEDFKNSFTYGKRSDLNFKFLSYLSDEEATEFIQKLLWKLGDAMDDGDWNRIVNHLIEGQIKKLLLP